MSKAVLIMDMPDCRADCDLMDVYPDGLYCIPKGEYFDGNDSTEEKPDWCPLQGLSEGIKIKKVQEK